MVNSKICSVEGCGKPFYARNLCNTHYIRLRINGDPTTRRNRVGTNHCQKKKCPAAEKIYNFMWSLNNAEERKQYKKLYRAREDVKAASLSYNNAWRAANPELFRQTQLEHRANHVEIYRSRWAKRRARKREAMPSWLTPDHISQINAVYAEAKRLEEETGIAYHVDHIVPLTGKTVCGLHVPWNLRAIPGDKNLRRPRIYSMDMD